MLLVDSSSQSGEIRIFLFEFTDVFKKYIVVGDSDYMKVEERSHC